MTEPSQGAVLTTVVDTVVPLFAVVALGWFLAGRRGFDPDALARLAVSVAAPALVFTLFAGIRWEGEDLPRLVLGALMVVGLVLGFGTVALRASACGSVGLLLPMAFWNGGNMGLSVVRLALGDEALPLGAVVFVTVATCQAVLGTALAKGRGGWVEVLRMPLVHACALGSACSLSGVTLPAFVSEPVAIVADLAIPLMLLTLGMSLRRLKITSARDGLLASVVRSGVGLAAGWLAVTLLDLQGVPRQVLLIESVLPPAVINVLFARRYGAAPEAVASAIVIGTLASVIVLPVTLLLVL